MPILLIDLLPSRPSQSIQPRCRAPQRIQIGIDLVLHLVVLAVGFKLELGPLGQAGGLLVGSGHGFAVQVFEGLFEAGVGFVTLASAAGQQVMSVDSLRFVEARGWTARDETSEGSQVDAHARRGVKRKTT